jgi:hypothetical protein
MPGRKSYIGRTNLNATQVTRATHSRLANDFVNALPRDPHCEPSGGCEPTRASAATS